MLQPNEPLSLAGEFAFHFDEGKDGLEASLLGGFADNLGHFRRVDLDLLTRH